MSLSIGPNFSVTIRLCSRRLKGMGKGVLGARETRGARGGSRALIFRTPATQASVTR